MKKSVAEGGLGLKESLGVVCIKPIYRRVTNNL